MGRRGWLSGNFLNARVVLEQFLKHFALLDINRQILNHHKIRLCEQNRRRLVFSSAARLRCLLLCSCVNLLDYLRVTLFFSFLKEYFLLFDQLRSSLQLLRLCLQDALASALVEHRLVELVVE